MKLFRHFFAITPRGLKWMAAANFLFVILFGAFFLFLQFYGLPRLMKTEAKVAAINPQIDQLIDPVKLHLLVHFEHEWNLTLLEESTQTGTSMVSFLRAICLVSLGNAFLFWKTAGLLRNVNRLSSAAQSE